jgi:hypothetical protein
VSTGLVSANTHVSGKDDVFSMHRCQVSGRIMVPLGAASILRDNTAFVMGILHALSFVHVCRSQPHD